MIELKLKHSDYELLVRLLEDIVQEDCFDNTEEISDLLRNIEGGGEW